MNLKRSRINASIREAIAAFGKAGIGLPPFASWTPEEWDAKGCEVDEIRHCMLGWDVTDFGSGEFESIGRTLFTLRNGSVRDPRFPKSYAEKLILGPESQRAPAHFHRSKTEDIINRSGGSILVQLSKASDDDSWSSEPLTIQVDGETRLVKAGHLVRLLPGESICIPARTIHQFWGETGTGMTVSSEVSSTCDDWEDNCFLAPAVRFPVIDEDEPRAFYLCHEYPAARP